MPLRKTFALFVDVVPADPKSERARIYQNVAISFGRVVRSRGHRLILQADTATTMLVLAASAQYHRMDQRDSHPGDITPLLRIFRPLAAADSQFAEDLGRPGEVDEQENHLWDVLGAWGGVMAAGTGREHSGFPFLDRDPLDVFSRDPPDMVVMLGRSPRLSPIIELISPLLNEREIPVFVDGDLVSGQEVNDSNLYATEKVLSHRQLAYRWHPPITDDRQRDFPTKETMTRISDAEYEARLCLALESLVERFGGDPEWIFDNEQ